MPGSGRGTKMIRVKSPSHTTVYVNFETPNHQTPGQLTTAANRRHGGHQTHDPEVLQGRAVDTAPLAEGEQVLPCYGRRRPQEGALTHATTRSESQEMDIGRCRPTCSVATACRDCAGRAMDGAFPRTLR